MQSNHTSFSDCEEFVDETEYMDLLKDVVADTYRAGHFIEMYFLSSEPDMQKLMWQIASLPKQRARMVQELVALLSKDAGSGA
jgi:hypothetical protein